MVCSMRTIGSHKGSHSTNGGGAQHILPDGPPLTLLIPLAGGIVRYRDLEHGSVDIGQLIHDFVEGRGALHDTAHLASDLAAATVERCERWILAFGQINAAPLPTTSPRCKDVVPFGNRLMAAPLLSSCLEAEGPTSRPAMGAPHGAL